MLDPQTGAIRRVTVAWESALELRVAEDPAAAVRLLARASETEAVRRLRLLGVEVHAARAGRRDARRDLPRDRARAGAPDARSPAAATVSRCRPQPALLDVPAGSYYVSLEQPLANLAIAALEPETPASFAANGVIAERRQRARMLARPELRAIGGAVSGRRGAREPAPVRTARSARTKGSGPATIHRVPRRV